VSQKPTVLVVDDSAFMRLALVHLLTQNGFDVIGEAADGQQAIDFCRLTRPDLVTMDIVMPNVDGLEALRQIKKLDRDIRVVMVSAMGERKSVMEALGAGADNFLVKPFDETKLLRVLSALDLGLAPLTGLP
jgi:two-component system chemotaxis response regulator CheY